MVPATSNTIGNPSVKKLKHPVLIAYNNFSKGKKKASINQQDLSNLQDQLRSQALSAYISLKNQLIGWFSHKLWLITAKPWTSNGTQTYKDINGRRILSNMINWQSTIQATEQKKNHLTNEQIMLKTVLNKEECETNIQYAAQKPSVSAYISSKNQLISWPSYLLWLITATN